MNEQNKNQNHEESSKNVMGERASRPSSWKTLLSKRWVYPAAYIAAAAIILTLVWVYQDTSTNPLEQNPATQETAQSSVTSAVGSTGQEQDSVEVVAQSENMVWPVANADEVSIVKPFFDETASEDEQAAAMVEYDQTFTANTGIDLARSDAAGFDVTAALSGKVTRVEQHPLMGSIVEITHDNNLKTVYQSLDQVKVKEGDDVKQEQVIATAGRSEMEKDLNNHLHFEVIQEGKPVNPTALLPQK
ncbi:M23 family metallopeptidase [Paenibacillus sp. P96]|uniref:M23 family metallopeptidase n=1 Tax=Paenibacillus zeirhizosphaerae TaxID=2987519 RepID=A0ABT9FN25_9BACL|nr:M23 family metallopeptidase [Paenibacillus sp. P96]MDP4096084.1 M23 family metallopeptidase [Paenibacillus sp. P96]